LFFFLWKKDFIKGKNFIQVMNLIK
jgi:hypothetical protein